MSSRPLNRAAVVGVGSMGHGIAQLLAIAGIGVTAVDVSNEILTNALQNIRWSMDKFVEKGKIRKEDGEAALARLQVSTNVDEGFTDADLIIEAASENLELKKTLFARMDRVAPAHAILASNTSALSITELGKATGRPDKVVGTHFFNPPQLMPLLEIIKGTRTSESTVSFAFDLAKRLNKTSILVKKDVMGFVVNRVLAAFQNEGFWVVERKEATKYEVDAATIKAGFPSGVFVLADYVGLDVSLAVAKELEEAFGARAKPSPMLEQLVKAGKLGRKSGEGLYSWSTGRPQIPPELATRFDPNRLYTLAVNSAAWLVYDDVATPADIDTGMKLGTGWVSGPCEYADEIGIDTVVDNLKELHRKYPEPMYETCPLLVEYVVKGWLGKKTSRGFHKYT